MDIDELDSNSSNISYTCYHEVSGSHFASVKALKDFASGMDFKERFGLVDQSLENTMNEGSETTLRLLVLMVLGASDE